ncbi:MAG: hypothetical protein AB1938_16400 [Myxococcota bacterium]
MLTALLLVALAQDPAGEAAPPPAETPTEPAAAAPTTDTPAPPSGEQPPAPAAPARNKQADEVLRAMKKLQDMPPDARLQAIEDLQKQFGGADVNPVLPPRGWAIDKFMDLTPVDQARVVARRYLEDLIAGDGRALVTASGLPFYFEERRIDRLDELRSEWTRVLRSRRADLLTLYSLEILTPADMEKKYGKSPQRLSGWNLRAPNTFVAVANLSGHATVLLLRQAGMTWQVLGFHD